MFLCLPLHYGCCSKLTLKGTFVHVQKCIRASFVSVDAATVVKHLIVRFCGSGKLHWPRDCILPPSGLVWQTRRSLVRLARVSAEHSTRMASSKCQQVCKGVSARCLPAGHQQSVYRSVLEDTLNSDSTISNKRETRLETGVMIANIFRPYANHRPTAV